MNGSRYDRFLRVLIEVIEFGNTPCDSRHVWYVDHPREEYWLLVLPIFVYVWERKWFFWLPLRTAPRQKFSTAFFRIPRFPRLICDYYLLLDSNDDPPLLLFSFFDTYRSAKICTDRHSKVCVLGVLDEFGSSCYFLILSEPYVKNWRYSRKRVNG